MAWPTSNRWTLEMCRKLGKMLDKEIATELKISIGAVGQMRKKLGIAAFRPRAKYHRWTPAETAMLGQQPDSVVAQAVKVKAKTINGRRQIVGRQSIPRPRLADMIAAKF